MLTGRPEVDRRFFARLLDDHLVVIDVDRMELRTLNPTATALWLLLGEGRRGADALAAAVAEVFAIDPAGATDGVAACLAEWTALGWVEGGGEAPLRLTATPATAPHPTGVTPATPGEIPPAMATAGIAVRLLGTDVVVEIGQADDPADPDLAPRLRAVLGGFPPAIGTPVKDPARLRFLVADDRTWIDTPAGAVWTTDPSDALSHVVLHLLLAGYPQADLLATVHAAAVGRPGGLLVMPGLSGCGKSTLTAHLVARGWCYAGDDIIALAAAPGRPPVVLPFPTAVSAKPGSWPLLAPLYPELAALPVVPYSGKLARFLPLPLDRHAGPGDAERTPRAIVFPRFDPDSAGELVPMSTLETVLDLVVCGFTTGDRLDRARLDQLFDLLEELPKYRLTFPSLETAEQCLSTLLP